MIEDRAHHQVRFSNRSGKSATELPNSTTPDADHFQDGTPRVQGTWKPSYRFFAICQRIILNLNHRRSPEQWRRLKNCGNTINTVSSTMSSSVFCQTILLKQVDEFACSGVAFDLSILNFWCPHFRREMWLVRRRDRIIYRKLRCGMEFLMHDGWSVPPSGDVPRIEFPSDESQRMKMLLYSLQLSLAFRDLTGQIR